MPSMSREKFLCEFAYDVERDFDVNGTPASWADTDQRPAHRYWGDEDHKIELVHEDDDPQCRLATSALTPDKEFVAASNGFAVSVYNIATKQRRMVFRGLTMPARVLLFSPCLIETGGYTLMISSSEFDRPDSDMSLLFLELSSDGRKIVQPQLLAIDKILNQSMIPVATQLEDLCGSLAASSLLDTTRAEYRKTLNKLQSSLESRDLRRLSGIRSFSPSPISSDGRLLLYLVAGQPAQEDLPPAEDSAILVAVHDLARNIQRHVLGDQSSSITWTGLSPDHKSIATLTRAGPLRIFDTVSGECKQEVSLPGGRYRGDWAPDSKHILLCGMVRQVNNERQTVSQSAYMAVYSTETGERIAQYTHQNLAPRSGAILTAWSPRNEIAVASVSHIRVWRPFENIVSTSLSIKIENPLMRLYANFVELLWAKEGRMLIARHSSGTIEVWDQDKNVKWRFQRPRGPGLTQDAKDCHWLEDSKTLVSLDLDASLRFYNF
ncbi:WD40 repeat-like protein, partial [Aureobasidium melanogenum]